MTTWGSVLAWIIPTAMVGFFCYQIGHANGRLLERAEMKDECGCGQTQTCAFGPGIVGEQSCRSSVYEKNEWTRCEPVKP